MKHDKCNYPECNKSAATSFALVPLCVDHFVLIRDETNKYYQSNSKVGNHMKHIEREHYHKISHLTPLLNKEAGRK
ncbi:hypothetical protein JUJ52_11130 [Virgibacillus sp. AGTR]|uniref:hypothetical protein n=1 Tax=Virgibacillus sp. AGTR TaxID=2812055 RepID=UPI00196560C2|nr:hypothetical protein [Virgibacillus sp. AGTR]MCC2250514.1 hypothetical protein [Virgibacillus sp. AGTR]QRZ18302.1 hypothetical protein JUJ52_00620 [Virgibacillus sp. AGTR]